MRLVRREDRSDHDHFYLASVRKTTCRAHEIGYYPMSKLSSFSLSKCRVEGPATKIPVSFG